MSDIYSFTATSINNEQINFERFRNKTLLIVNVASRCGFTKQYAELEQLYRDYQTRGLEILGFPCNQFGGQEPGTEEQIKQFCDLNYQVSFPLFAKIAVNGPDAHPLFNYLKNHAKGLLGSTAIKWNFTKFLVDKQGQVITRFAPAVAPRKIEKDIVGLL